VRAHPARTVRTILRYWEQGASAKGVHRRLSFSRRSAVHGVHDARCTVHGVRVHRKPETCKLRRLNRVFWSYLCLGLVAARYKPLPVQSTGQVCTRAMTGQGELARGSEAEPDRVYVEDPR